MRIGILSLPLHTNYGGILQAFALKTVLERNGHSVKIFCPTTPKIGLKYRLKLPYYYLKRIVSNLCGHKVPVFWEHKINAERPKIRQHILRFINVNFDIVYVDDFRNIGDREFDAIIVGSDQVWRPKYFESLYAAPITDAFLGFAEKWSIKRMAYAASFGVANWEYSMRQTDKCRKLIKRFDAVSVREDSAVTLCSEKLSIKAELVLDPTMLLNAEDYISLLSNSQLSSKKNIIMTYILDNNEFIDEVVQIIKNRTGYPIYAHRPESSDINDCIDKRILPSVEDWIDGVYQSKMIITDSFHACVFSILFHKPFLVIINDDRGATRFISLLKMFGLEDRIINSVEAISDSLLVDPLPESVYTKLDEFRVKSYKFLDQLYDE